MESPSECQDQIHMPRQYNFIYEKLVEDEEDVIGHIAYALYKSDKITFISDFKQSHNNTDPTEDDLHKFHDFCCIDKNLDRYKMQAVIILRSFLDDTLAETTKQIESDYIKNQNNHLESIISPLKPDNKWIQFFRGVGQSILGAFFFALIVAAFQFIKEYQAENNTANSEVHTVVSDLQHDSDSISVSQKKPEHN